MKKIAYEYNVNFDILDPKDYIIIKEDNQNISDKYVDFDGKKINEYDYDDALKKGDVVIRGFYYIWFYDDHIIVNFSKFKYYDRYRNIDEFTSKLKQDIRMKNSSFDFDHVKGKIIEFFSKEIRLYNN